MNNNTSEQIKELKKQIILLENNTSNQYQYKEHIINVIKELKQEIILIENKIEELRIFYITNKGNYNYKLATTFFKNLQDFFEKERIKNLADLPTNQDFSQEYFIRYYSKYSSNIIEKYIYDCRNTNHPHTPESMILLKKEADKLFNLICNEEEDKLLFKMLMFENKLKYYENRLTKLYPEPDSENVYEFELELDKSEIKNTTELYLECEKSLIENKKYSILVSVIILVLTVLYVITVVLFVKYNL
jgi:hypothetical protein